MKLTKNILTVALVSALALPLASFAAEGKKGGGKGGDAFAKADTNSDGAISEAEFIAAAAGKGKEDALKKRFATMDKNSDGKLSKEEFAAGRQGGGKKKKEN
ncbi:MAG TPA: EF-hand domain-containing protein [Opitutaceae bacterium]